MKFTRVPFRSSFQSKVIVPVVLVVVAVIVVTLWTVNRHFSAQLEADAAQSLLTSDAVFQNTQRFRAKSLSLRFGNVPNEPRFKAVAQLDDLATMRQLLRDLVAEVGVQYIAFTTWNGRHVCATNPDRRDGVVAFGDYAVRNTPRVLEGQTVFNLITTDGRIVEAVSIPVVVGASTIGALTFGTELGDEVAREFHQLSRCEVAFFANGRITATTLPRSALDEHATRSLLGEPMATGPHADPTEQVQKITLGGEHMLHVLGRFKGTRQGQPVGYVLLTSYEQPLATLAKMQRLLLAVGGICVLIATLIVWGAVRRVTQPLRQLRDAAVAIGKGDFSQRVEVRTADECGQLATAFNRMTEQLDQTIETLRSTRAQLTQSEKLSAVGEFVAGVTHELNNPLTSVIGFAELLQRAKLDDRNGRQVEMIVREAHRCHRIVQSLLSFARQHKPERKPTNVNQVLDAAIDILAYQMRTSNIQVERRLSPQLPAVIADAHQLQQVFINIINNARQAIEAHRPDGRIRVSTQASATHVEITFHDNGPGISEENLAKIFDPFFTTKRVGQGTGLGLSLCYGIVQEHGGTIAAQSPPGDGAKFLITLPVATDAVVDEPNVRVPATAAPAGHGKSVLVVDDEESILNLAREVLTGEHYEVDIASDGDTAIRKAHQRRYDVIVCDWKMPGLTGRQVYERLCVVNPEAAKRFIFMTGDVVSDTTRDFLATHNRTCVSKPFSLADLSAAIHQALDASRN